MSGSDLRQRKFHILGHVLRIATHVKMCSGLEPLPQLTARFPHAILYVDFLCVVARPCRRKSRKSAFVQETLPLIAVEEIRRLVLMTEEEPCRPGSGLPGAFVEERAEGCNTCPRAHHDDWCGRVDR